MKTQSQSETTFQKIAEILSLALIGLGFVLDWLKFSYAGLILILGFLLYGIFGVIISIKRKYYKGISIRFFKLVNDVAIILLAIGFFLRTKHHLLSPDAHPARQADPDTAGVKQTYAFYLLPLRHCSSAFARLTELVFSYQSCLWHRFYCAKGLSLINFPYEQNWTRLDKYSGSSCLQLLCLQSRWFGS